MGNIDVELRVGYGIRMEAMVVFNDGTGPRPERGTVTPFVAVGKLPLDTFRLGDGNPELNPDPVTGKGSLPVEFTVGKGQRAEAVALKLGRGGKRPEADALKLLVVVKLPVGKGNNPELGREMEVEFDFTVEFAVGKGKKPELGAVAFNFAVEFEVLLTVG